MLHLFTDLGFATAGLFLAVLLIGTLAGVISYGYTEIVSRQRIQRHQTARLIDQPLRRAFTIEGHGSVLERLRRRYQADELSVADGHSVSSKTPDRHVARYVARLRKALDGEQGFIATLLGLPSPSLYRLHYRQFCGQVAARINREAVESGIARREPAMPVTDALSLIAPGWDRALPASQSVTLTPEWKRLDAFDRQSQSERAMAVVDLLQISVSEAIARHVLKVSASVTGLIFFVLLASGARYLNFASESDFVGLRVIGTITALVGAGIVAILLVCAACIIAMLTFRLIDSVASPR